MESVYTFYEKTIIDSIDLEYYILNDDIDLFDRIQMIYNIFMIEYVNQNNKHLNEEFLFSEWVRGLPSVLSVPCYYDEIINNATNADVKIKDEEIFCEEYWANLSRAFFTLKENL